MVGRAGQQTLSHQKGLPEVAEQARKQVPGSASDQTPGSGESVSHLTTHLEALICLEPGFTPEPVGQGCLPSTALCSIGSQACDQVQLQRRVALNNVLPKVPLSARTGGPCCQGAGRAVRRASSSLQAETGGGLCGVSCTG